MITVPNKFPTIDPGNQRLALIGEAPGDDELIAGEPFVGMSGRHLASHMSKAGLPLQCCFKGNICQHQPEKNDISTFAWNGEEITSGITQLEHDLALFKPNIIVLLGNIPLKWAKDKDTIKPLKKNSFKYKVSSWRGSLFTDSNQRKCLATFHPAYCLRDYKVVPLVQFDLKRAVSESKTPDLTLPERLIKFDLPFDQLIECLRQLRSHKRPIALDIEGGIGSMSCISFAQLESLAFVVPFIRKDGSNIWPAEQERQLFLEIARVLEDPNVPKILQNAMYDTFVLQYSYNICVRNVTDDTMLKHWSLYAELRKSLALQTSIYTHEPYYKHERLQDKDDNE